MNRLKTMALIASLIALYIGANAQTLTPQQNKKSKWGYVNEVGKAVIKHKYNNARIFSEGLAAVSLIDKSGMEKFGFIDDKGEVIIPLIYDEVSDFLEGNSKIRIGYKLGIVNKTGVYILPVEYTEISKFSDDLLKAKKDNYWIIIDKTGNGIAYYTEIGELSEGLARVRSNNKCGYIDKTGKVVIPVEYKEISAFSDDLLKAEEDHKGWNRYHIIDKTGKIIAKYSWVGEFSEGLARVRSGFEGYIDKTGKVVIPLEYRIAEDFSGEFARVSKDDTWYSWGIIDKTGTPVLPFEYEENKIKSMPPSEFVQKEIQRKAEIETLFDKTEAVLDNDYYSANCHPENELRELIAQLEAIDKELSFGNPMRNRSTNLRIALYDAIKKQRCTKKFGIATAKKIIAGKYEIGMSKAVCLEIAYHVTIVGQTANTELWRASTLGSTRDTYLHFSGDKLVRISY